MDCEKAQAAGYSHTVLKIDRKAVLNWPDEEVISRLTKLYKPSPIVDRYLTGIKLTKSELAVVAEDIEKWRHRLYDVSWFMRNLNESIAREAKNKPGQSGNKLHLKVRVIFVTQQIRTYIVSPDQSSIK